MGLLKAGTTGWPVTTVSQPPGESRKTESDLRSDKALANAQPAHPAGPEVGGRSPPLRERRQGTPECGNLYLNLECPGVCSSTGRRLFLKAEESTLTTVA